MSLVLIVGAGPAGIRAAECLAEAGLYPVVVDEGARAGGQIYRRPPQGFTRPGPSLYGTEAEKAADLHRTFDALVEDSRVRYRPRSSVLALRDGAAQVLGPAGMSTLPYDRLLLATGASDRLMPVPGWQGAGVYSLGATQIALKSQGVAVGRRIVLAGSGPLLTLVATQLRAAGASVAAVLETASMAAQIAGGLRMAAARPVVTARGARMRLGLGRRYHAGVTLERIATDAGGVTAIHWRDARGNARETSCDAVALGWHLRAETPLADLAGVPFDWSDTWAQWLPRADAMGRTGGDTYLAGDGLRILGADGAELSGRLAAIACLQDLGRSAPDPTPYLHRQAGMTRFGRGVAQAFPWPARAAGTMPDDTVLCRCEGVTAGELRAVAAETGPEANRAKALSRVGMGRCQGRFCQLAGAEVMAHAVGMEAACMGRMRSQSPVRPAPVAALIAEDSATDPAQHSS